VSHRSCNRTASALNNHRQLQLKPLRRRYSDRTSKFVTNNCSEAGIPYLAGGSRYGNPSNGTATSGRCPQISVVRAVWAGCVSSVIAVGIDFVVLNGGSSSGKTSIARRLQDLLMPDVWLALAVDDLIAALPRSAIGDKFVITFQPDGHVGVGPDFHRLEAAWIASLAVMARAGVGVIIDELFLDGSASQRRLGPYLAELNGLWVGVHCDPAVAAARAAARSNRHAGTAAAQAETVHRGVVYDLEVDTTNATSAACAEVVAQRIAHSCGSAANHSTS
jgi:chloramphenicol 3-O phosphotransferase